MISGVEWIAIIAVVAWVAGTTVIIIQARHEIARLRRDLEGVTLKRERDIAEARVARERWERAAAPAPIRPAASHAAPQGAAPTTGRRTSDSYPTSSAPTFTDYSTHSSYSSSSSGDSCSSGSDSGSSGGCE